MAYYLMNKRTGRVLKRKYSSLYAVTKARKSKSRRRK
jgi:hypothetical protein